MEKKEKERKGKFKLICNAVQIERVSEREREISACKREIPLCGGFI